MFRLSFHVSKVQVYSQSNHSSELHLFSFSDPGSVLGLLRAAVSVDKLTLLLQQEYRGDKEQLQTFQSKLEGEHEA